MGNTKNNIEISIIVPAYKQEKTIEKDILRIQHVLDIAKYEYEIIVVVDGFNDKTYENAKKIKSKTVIVVGYETNKGKGNAIRYGIAKAKGAIIAFIDAGMDIDPNGISLLIEQFKWQNADIVVGSKLHTDSKVDYPTIRKLMSFIYRVFVRVLFGLSVSDTQVGLKIFRKEVLEDVLPRLLVKRYALDIEILAVSYHLGYRNINEGPIELNFDWNNSIISKNLWKTIFLMVWDTIAVFYRLKILRYYDSSNKRKWKYDPELNFRVNLP